eukprot:gene23120-1408_t
MILFWCSSQGFRNLLFPKKTFAAFSPASRKELQLLYFLWKLSSCRPFRDAGLQLSAHLLYNRFDQHAGRTHLRAGPRHLPACFRLLHADPSIRMKSRRYACVRSGSATQILECSASHSRAF